jgi:hypothetical protein
MFSSFHLFYLSEYNVTFKSKILGQKETNANGSFTLAAPINHVQTMVTLPSIIAINDRPIRTYESTSTFLHFQSGLRKLIPLGDRVLVRRLVAQTKVMALISFTTLCHDVLG